MLRISGVSAGYDNVVLKNVSFEVPEGTIAGIVGPSGGGKSTLLRIVGGLQQPASGTVHWKGVRVKGPQERLIPGHDEIQLVNQDFALDLYHTVFQNVIQKILYLERTVRDAFATELIELAGLENLAGKQAILLSGGEQQRLSIIRALASEPEVLLLDEPFAHLDSHLKDRLGDYIRELCRIRNMTCLLVSHEGQDVVQWAGEIHFLDGGVIQRSGSPEEFFNRPESAYEARYFGEINEVFLGGKHVLFRPNQYEVDNLSPELAVSVTNSSFAGYYWRNLACTERGEKLVLFAQKPLKDVRGINIRKQDQTA